MKPIGIVVAMTAEARSLTKESIVADEMIRMPEGALIQISGIGAPRAERAASHLLKQGVGALLSWGTAGGLIPTASPGSLVIPNVIIGVDQRSYPTHPAWRERLVRQLNGCLDLYQEPLAESVTALKSSAEKKVLFERTGAIAADMESRSVAKAADEAHVPFMAIRAISDSANMALPGIALAAVDEFGQVNLLGLLKELSRHPLEIFPMIRLGRGFRTALLTLAMVAHLVGNNFLVPR